MRDAARERESPRAVNRSRAAVRTRLRADISVGPSVGSSLEYYGLAIELVSAMNYSRTISRWGVFLLLEHHSYRSCSLPDASPLVEGMERNTYSTPTIVDKAH